MIWLILLPVCLVGELIAVLLSPALPLFLGHGDNLPRWLAWFDTPDNPTWGDEKWQLTHKRTYSGAVLWLIRNRAYGFKLGVLGCKQQPYTVHGNPLIKNRDNATPGWLFLDGHAANWYFKLIQPIGFNCCIQLAFGWQLDAPINGRHLYMFSPRVTRFYRA